MPGGSTKDGGGVSTSTSLMLRLLSITILSWSRFNKKPTGGPGERISLMTGNRSFVIAREVSPAISLRSSTTSPGQRSYRDSASCRSAGSLFRCQVAIAVFACAMSAALNEAATFAAALVTTVSAANMIASSGRTRAKNGKVETPAAA